MKKFMRLWLIISLGMLTVSSTFAAAESLNFINQSNLPIQQISINDYKFQVEIVTSPQDLQKGLMHRQTLAANCGMLFIFSKAQQVTFWMRNTFVSLDVLFIDEQGIIKWIYPNAQPESEQRITCPEHVKMMLEIPSGTVKKLRIKQGDKLIMDQAQYEKNKSRQTLIEQAWETRNQFSSTSRGDDVWAIQSVMEDLDKGYLRVAEKQDHKWVTNEWIKKAVLLSFRLKGLELVEKPVYGYDKVDSKFANWTINEFEQAGFRVVPGALVRHSAYIEHNAVLMPSFTNVGARVGEGTMVDIWATVGSCAQIGKNCHLSAGVIIGGVLEPVQAQPVIIEDDCFIGAQSAVVEGVVIEQGVVIGMGVMLGASTPIIDRETGVVTYGRIPAYSVVIAGVMPAKEGSSVQIPCAVIVKHVDAKTRSRTAINELLRS